MAYHAESQKKYNQKSKFINLKFTPNDIEEYIRVKTYTDEIGTSTQGYIKALIKADLDAKNIPYPALDPLEEPW